MTEKDPGIQTGLNQSDSNQEPVMHTSSDDEFEVFKTTGHGVDFRTVSWQRASILFLKILFATGVLSIPAAMYTLVAAPGALIILGFGLLYTYVGRYCSRIEVTTWMLTIKGSKVTSGTCIPAVTRSQIWPGTWAASHFKSLLAASLWLHKSLSHFLCERRAHT